MRQKSDGKSVIALFTAYSFIQWISLSNLRTTGVLFLALISFPNLIFR